MEISSAPPAKDLAAGLNTVMARLRRMRMVSPSKLGAYLACPLRYLLESELPKASPIKVSPVALLGTAVHAVAEGAETRTVPSRAETFEALKYQFQKLACDQSKGGPLISWIWGRFGIDGLVSYQRLLSMASFARTLVDKGRARGVSDYTTNPSTQHTIPEGRERWLESSSLGICGQADLILREEENSVSIIDFKTGRVLDQEGRPKDSYLLQLAAYGQIIRERDPAITIRLRLVSPSDHWEGIFDDALCGWVEEVLNELGETIPVGQVISPEEIAKVGDHCGDCSYRPCCGRYQRQLTEIGEIGFLRAKNGCFDFSGEILDVLPRDGFVHLRCRLSNGDLAKVWGIPESILDDTVCKQGHRFNAYGLGTLEKSSAGVLPRNFFVVRQDFPRDSAFGSYIESRDA
ncbi:PD-(D/E)XK nuclease family protein [Chromobacterium haemolyticum]|uniref:PD-(D/E)XK nuclease family protein n=1 Tax=Chromobacterium haemolyticum TaxID=394935 RepID=UPI0017467A0F|nr:PD-(D/E)XK nuclease family protein [Chromobacterium haemolyticum]QOD82941.1 PD-(D/E)XK nuclease family protein [Chromobacterium haemolyticum]